ncbi:MAG TPA: hypothetical protein VH331_13985 [Allosphingosinicella sp.]|nr:hypothetical protein [Allosphingosinicella sp.]
MTHFEFVFSLFGLLLGLSLAEVLGGAVRTLKARRRVRVGWLTPLLGLFVMLNLVSFWMGAWNAQALIPVAYPALLIGLVIAGLYYMAASLVFPEDPDKWPDFDAYYFEHRRQVLGGIWLCNIMVFALSLWVRRITPSGLAILVDGVPSLLVIVAMVSRNRTVGIAMLSLLVAIYLLLWIAI